MLESITFLESAFDLLSSPFLIISTNGINISSDEKIKCIYNNSAFNNEFILSGLFTNSEEVGKIFCDNVKNTSHIINKKYNIVIRLSDDKENRHIYRVSYILSDNDIISLTLESLAKFNDPVWNNILLNNTAIVYSTKPTGDYAFNFISDNVEEILGFHSNVFVKANDFWDSLIDPDYTSYVINTLRSLESYNEVKMVYPIKNSDGEYKWFEERAKLVRHFDGTAKEIVGMVIDINEQKLSFDNLKKTLEELRTIINTIPGIIIVFDTALKTLDYSESLLQIIPDEIKEKLKGLSPFEIFPEIGANLTDDLFHSMQTGNSLSRLATKEEDVIFKDSFKIIINPIKSDNGSVWGAVLIMFNISDFISKENELKCLVTNLEESRKAELENTEKIKSLFTELENSQQNLININNQKDKFFSIIAHDLRTPLKGFMQLTKILTSEIGKMPFDEVQELTKTMYESSQNIYKLLDNLLEWAKIQTGKADYNPITMQLSTLVMMNIDLMLPSARQKRIKLINDVPNNVLVFTDVNIINTIIRNLISNALKFSYFDTNIKISAKLTKNHSVEICVCDQGIGMNEETQNRLFRLDSQITSLGTNDESGTGLGLILCHDLVEINGGSIWVESSAGNGSRFYFSVPAREKHK